MVRTCAPVRHGLVSDFMTMQIRNHTFDVRTLFRGHFTHVWGDLAGAYQGTREAGPGRELRETRGFGPELLSTKTPEAHTSFLLGGRRVFRRALRGRLFSEPTSA